VLKNFAQKRKNFVAIERQKNQTGTTFGSKIARPAFDCTAEKNQERCLGNPPESCGLKSETGADWSLVQCSNWGIDIPEQKLRITRIMYRAAKDQLVERAWFEIKCTVCRTVGSTNSPGANLDARSAPVGW
jgi:hypothetical protein